MARENDAMSTGQALGLVFAMALISFNVFIIMDSIRRHLGAGVWGWSLVSMAACFYGIYQLFRDVT